MGADAVGLHLRPVAPARSRPTRPATSSGACRPRSSPSACSATSRPSGSSRSSQHAGLRGAQLHGHETPEDDAVRSRRGSPFVIQAFAAGDPTLERADDVRRRRRSCSTRPRPGSGEVFDWALAEGAPLGMRVILAGGLTPDNVGRGHRPGAAVGRRRVDRRRGGPGRKDPRKAAGVHRRRPRGRRPLALPAAPTRPPYDWQDE